MSEVSVSRFSELALAAPVLKAVDEVGYEFPSPIQAQSIPPLLEGRDLLGQAQTGTGKTAAFALPLLSGLDLSVKQPQILVLTPTRELAIQVAEAVQTYARHLKGFHVLPVYGGQSIVVQLRQLHRGVHTVVGTPGRVLDHLRRGTLQLDNLRCVVLDEADEMLRMGFIEDVQEILDYTPEEKQVALFSATLPSAIRRVAAQYLKDPVEIRIETKTATVATVTQRYWQVRGVHKLDALTRILEVEEFDAMLVFVRTKTATVELAEKLEARGHSCAALNGDMNQAMREKTIDNLKKGRLDIVVATDVAARGLDVERVSHVINYDIPYDAEAYVHRIGRTGRAGRKGEAILFVSPREQRMLRSIEKATRQAITQMQLPTHEDIVGRRVGKFKQTLTETIESQELSFFEELIASYQQEHATGLSEIGAALAYLVQREQPLLVPKPIKPPAPERARRESSRQKRPSKLIEQGMIRYRLEVGRENGVMPKNIVGAIANEAGLPSRHIGPISLHPTYSTVDLPDGMPKSVLKHLKKVWVCGQQLQLTPFEAGSSEEKPRRKPRAKTHDKSRKRHKLRLAKSK
jgi:ATP-dependent RNA helicase DeaD